MRQILLAAQIVEELAFDSSALHFVQPKAKDENEHNHTSDDEDELTGEAKAIAP